MLPATSTSTRSFSFEMDRASISLTMMWSSTTATRMGAADKLPIDLQGYRPLFGVHPRILRILWPRSTTFCLVPHDSSTHERLSFETPTTRANVRLSLIHI